MNKPKRLHSHPNPRRVRSQRKRWIVTVLSRRLKIETETRLEMFIYSSLQSKRRIIDPENASIVWPRLPEQTRRPGEEASCDQITTTSTAEEPLSLADDTDPLHPYPQASNRRSSNPALIILPPGPGRWLPPAPPAHSAKPQPPTTASTISRTPITSSVIVKRRERN